MQIIYVKNARLEQFFVNLFLKICVIAMIDEALLYETGN